MNFPPQAHLHRTRTVQDPPGPKRYISYRYIHFPVPAERSDTEPLVTNKIILSHYVMMFIIEGITPYFMLVPSPYEKSQYVGPGGIHYLSAEGLLPIPYHLLATPPGDN